MSALASTDVTVTISAGDRNIAGGAAFKNVSMASITFGTGVLTYPTGGVPMPAIGSFGFHKEIQFVAIEQPPANGFVYKFDRSNHKLKIFTQGMTTGSTTAADSSTGSLIENSAAAETAARLMGTAVDTTYDLGAMIELPSTIAPASVTLKMLMIGE